MQEIEGGRRGNRVADRRGQRRGNHVEEPSCDNRQQACIGESVMSVHWYNQSLPHFNQINLIYRLLQEPFNCSVFFFSIFFYILFLPHISKSNIYLHV